MAEKIAYYFHGDEGEYVEGVPARDLTEADLGYLTPLQQRDVREATVARGDKRINLYTTSKGEPKPVETAPDGEKG